MNYPSSMHTCLIPPGLPLTKGGDKEIPHSPRGTEGGLLNNKLRRNISQTNHITNLSSDVESTWTSHAAGRAIFTNSARQTQRHDQVLRESKIPVVISVHKGPHQIRNRKFLPTLAQT